MTAPARAAALTVVSLGPNGEVAHHIRHILKQDDAYPFDGLLVPAASVEALLDAGLAGLVRPEALRAEAIYDGNLKRHRHIIVDDTQRVQFHHDFPDSADFVPHLPQVQGKYAVMAQRFEQLCASGRSVLFVHIGASEEAAARLERAILRRFPDLDFRLLVVDPAEGAVPGARGRVVRRPLSTKGRRSMDESRPAWEAMLRDVARDWGRPLAVRAPWREVFRSADLVIDHRGDAAPGQRLVITFDPLGAALSARSRLSERWIERMDFDHAHVFAGANNYFQTPNLDAACDALLRLRAPYADVTLLGFSMGGYGALLLSRRLMASRVIAMAPWFSPDPEKVPWDTRWLEARQALRFGFDDMPAQLDTPARKYMLFDPMERSDRRHAALLAGLRGVHSVVVPFGGHFLGPFLNEVEALDPAMRIMFEDGEPGPCIQQRRRARRQASPGYFLRLGQRLAAGRGVERALSVIDRVERTPTMNIACLQSLFQVLQRLNETVGLAFLVHRRLLQVDPKWDRSGSLDGRLRLRLPRARAGAAVAPALPAFDIAAWDETPDCVIEAHRAAIAGHAAFRGVDAVLAELLVSPSVAAPPSGLSALA